jgi:formiminoglutamase
LFYPPDPSLFFSKNDPEDQRLGDIVKSYNGSEQKNDIVILGYPDDEGIRINGGRVGAAQGPEKVRQFLYRMTLPESYFLSKRKTSLFDYGNLEATGDLTIRHTKAKAAVTQLYAQGCRLLSLGGGHDYAYADGAGFISQYFKTYSDVPLIINFDAHLDVRKPVQGPNSGTAFYRLITDFKNQFDLLEIGLQPQCNSVHHLKWAQDQGVDVYFLNDLKKMDWPHALNIPLLKKRKPGSPIFVSFDIDCLTAAEAGGCSQAWATGLRVDDCLKFLAALYAKFDVRHLGVYEVSPPLDRDFQTSKTAALLLHQYLFHPAVV